MQNLFRKLTSLFFFYIAVHPEPRAARLRWPYVLHAAISAAQEKISKQHEPQAEVLPGQG